MTPGTRGRARRTPVAAVLLGGLVALVAAGCLPRAVTSQGRSIADLYTVFLIGGGIVAALVWGLVTWAIIRYRKRDDSLPEQVHGSARLEFAWTAIPVVTVLVLFALTLMTLASVEGGPSARSADAAPSGPAGDPGASFLQGGGAPPASGTGGSVPPGAAETGVPAPAGDVVLLEVEAFRWGWRFRYPEEGVTVSGAVDAVPEAVLPVGQDLRVTLTAVDVIHAWYVPQFLYKRDAVPGHPSTFNLRIEEAGIYGGQCAELCGVFHARMPFSIRAVPVDEYRAWVEQSRGAAQP